MNTSDSFRSKKLPNESFHRIAATPGELGVTLPLVAGMIGRIRPEYAHKQWLGFFYHQSNLTGGRKRKINELCNLRNNVIYQSVQRVNF